MCFYFFVCSAVLMSIELNCTTKRTKKKKLNFDETMKLLYCYRNFTFQSTVSFFILTPVHQIDVNTEKVRVEKNIAPNY